jgi:N-acetylneuraminate synthase
MSEIKLANKRVVGDYLNPYVIAEINTSHFGNLALAKEMITSVFLAGCDCVKFQSWSEESLYSKSYYDENPIAKRFVKKFSFSENELLELAEFAHELGIDFASTPYSMAEAEFLAQECNVPFLKVASMELNNLDFLTSLTKIGLPLIVSTGMGDTDEILSAYGTLIDAQASFSMLHCVSSYPTPIEEVNLHNIIGLRKILPGVPIGFSDHSLGVEMAIAATALGAAVIEKHFTLDKSKVGMDNQMAIETGELEQLVRGVRNVNIGLGGVSRKLSKAEFDQRFVMRRSIVAAETIPEGSHISMDKLLLKRPGSGLGPEKLNEIVGKKVKREIQADMLISEIDLEF